MSCGCAACNRGTPQKGFFAEEVVSLEEALDRYPCIHCGSHYNNHMNLSQDDIDHARDRGCVVHICEKRQRYTFDEDGYEEGPAFFCVVITPPDDPCDSDFMEEISS